jgi:dipeptidase E
MKLLLTSAGLSNKSIVESFLNLVGKPFSEINLAYIPTAANVEKGDKTWLINDLANCINLNFKQVDIVDLSAISKEMWLPRLKEADVLLFGGGNTSHLMYWINKSGLGELLEEMLKTKIFVGISAGSMVVGKSLDLSTSERLYEEEILGDKKDEGLGYVDFLVRPHLNSPYFPNVNLDNLKLFSENFPETFYAIDDQTAIKLIDSNIEIISEGIWKKFN